MNTKNWAARSNMPALGVFRTSDHEISFYVTRAYGTPDVRLERMVLRVDGFSSLSAGYKTGEVVTKPLILQSKNMYLNYSTSAFGYIKIIFMDEEGHEIEGFGEKDAIEMVGDKVDQVVTCTKEKAIESLIGKKVRMKFLMKDAHLYSLYVSDTL